MLSSFVELDLTLSAANGRSPRKPKGHGGERREEILAHAQRLIATHGVQSVSTRHIAEAVGISQPTLYAYFPTRSDILEQVSARAFGQLAAEASAAQIGPGDPLEQMIRAYIRFGLENPDAYRIAFMLEGLFDVGEASCEDGAMKSGIQAFDHVRQTVGDRLGVAHPDLERAAQSTWAAAHGLVSLLLARPGFPWVDRDALIDQHVAALLKGFPEAEFKGSRHAQSGPDPEQPRMLEHAKLDKQSIPVHTPPALRK